MAWAMLTVAVTTVAVTSRMLLVGLLLLIGAGR
jgi:hypothetical protein